MVRGQIFNVNNYASGGQAIVIKYFYSNVCGELRQKEIKSPCTKSAPFTPCPLSFPILYSSQQKARSYQTLMQGKPGP